MSAFGREQFIKKVARQFWITGGWWGNEKRRNKTGADPYTSAAALGATAFLWSPPFVTRAAVNLFKPIALGYTIGALIGIGIARAVWGKEGAADAADFYTGQVDMTEYRPVQNITTHYTTSLASWILTPDDPVVEEITYDLDFGPLNQGMSREQQLELGLISVDEYMVWWNAELKKMEKPVPRTPEQVEYDNMVNQLFNWWN